MAALAKIYILAAAHHKLVRALSLALSDYCKKKRCTVEQSMLTD